MSNIAKVLKAEIVRISKREVKGATQGIGKSNTWLRKVVADLKKRLLLLEKENKRLMVTMKKYQVESPEKPDQEEGKKARLHRGAFAVSGTGWDSPRRVLRS